MASAPYKRGLRNQMVQDVRPLSAPKGASMVGEAYTLRYMPTCEDLYPATDETNLDAFAAWRTTNGR